jgi:putative colanic acid biosynthesis UDP-glucose lipid carrier transferase
MTSKKPSGWAGRDDSDLAPLMRVVDATIILLSLWMPTVVRGETWDQRSWATATVGAVLFVLVGQLLRLYDSSRGVPLKQRLMLAWGGWFGGVVPMLLFLVFITKSSADYSRVIITAWFVLAPFLIGVWRTSLTLCLRELRKRGYNTRSTAIVGMTDLGEQLAKRMRDVSWLGLRLYGFFDDRAETRDPSPEQGSVERVGNFDDLVELARKGEIELIYITLPLRAEPRINELLRRLGDTTASVHLATDFLSFDLLHARWGAIGDVPTVSIHETPFYGVDGWLKRLEDLVLGAFILLLISVPMLIIALAIKLTSPGPVFFRQRRYGLNGEVIDVLKFRSMTVTEDDDKVKQATKGDARITPLGALLRRYSLDELPQFLNVLTGQMSIVGPRPHAVIHNEEYRKQIQGYMLRHKVKPGITGWAQVNGWRGETDTLEKMEKRVEHDLDYIRNWSLLWDLQIIAMTVFGSGARKNAY